MKKDKEMCICGSASDKRKVEKGQREKIKIREKI